MSLEADFAVGYLFSLPILSSLPGDGRARAGVISESGHTGADESSA
jgi:hypothetical protein